MASSGQTTPQAPQLMHSSGSMTWRSLRSPVMASVGQRLMHAVQPVQFSVMMVGIVGDPLVGGREASASPPRAPQSNAPSGDLQGEAERNARRAKLFRRPLRRRRGVGAR